MFLIFLKNGPGNHKSQYKCNFFFFGGGGVVFVLNYIIVDGNKIIIKYFFIEVFKVGETSLI